MSKKLCVMLMASRTVLYTSLHCIDSLACDSVLYLYAQQTPPGQLVTAAHGQSGVASAWLPVQLPNQLPALSFAIWASVLKCRLQGSCRFCSYGFCAF